MPRTGPWVALALICLLAAPTAAWAEQQDWETVSNQLFVIRQTWWLPFDESFAGLWAFDPGQSEYEWLRPFHFNNQHQGMIPRSRTGFGVYLAGGDGRLVVQTWPYFFDFDIQSLRLLRRYPPIDDPASAGWAVQGAMVPKGPAAEWGIEAGFYGFPLCLMHILSSGSESLPDRCPEYLFPGHSDPLSGLGGDTSVLLRRGLAPDDASLHYASDTVAYPWQSTPYCTVDVPPLLSLDPELQGIWRGTPRGAEFLAVREGVIEPPSLAAEFSFPPFDNPEIELDALFFHPRHERFYGVSRIPHRGERWFFSLDRALEPVETYEASSQCEGTPITLASTGGLPETYEQLVPVITHAEGRLGTFWTSDLWLFNPCEHTTTVRMSRLGRPGDVRTLDLAARASLRISDVLVWLGGGPDGDGMRHDALVLSAPYRWGAQVVAVSRVLTAGHKDHGGTFGQAVPAVPGLVGYTNHLHHVNLLSTYIGIGDEGLRMSNLTPDRRDLARFRHNLGVTNTGDEPLTITLAWGFSDLFLTDVEPNRPPETVQEITVPPRQVSIVNLEELFPAEVRDAWAARIAVFGERPAALWLSMVDNITGDATFVPFSNYHWPTDSNDNRVAVPAVTHGAGQDGTFWRTTLYGVQGNGLDWPYGIHYDRPTAYLHPSEPARDCGGAALAGEISTFLEGEVGVPLDAWIDTLAGDGDPPPEDWAEFGWRTVFPDVVHLFEPCAEDTQVRAALEVSAAAWMTGYSRTHTTREDGGSYGGMLPFYPVGGWPVQHFAGLEVCDELRVNVGLFNGDHDHAIAHRLTLYAADGDLSADKTLTLEPLASVQLPLHHLFDLGQGDLAEGTYGLTVTPLDDEEAGVKGRSWAYVSVVDNVTGDPTNWW